MNTLSLDILEDNHAYSVYGLKDFEPKRINQAYLKELGVVTQPLPETLARLEYGSTIFIKRYAEGSLTPKPQVQLGSIPLDTPLPIHNYTGRCPTCTYEINPVVGCNVGCLYCLVSDGTHVEPLIAYENYNVYLREKLEANHEMPLFYYFSPKTEAFQEPTLQTGIAHKILREFIQHFKRHPNSKARVFIASKAGIKQLLFADGGETILDLMMALTGKLQFNTSISIMHPIFRNVLEPTAASIADRLLAVKECQRHNILAGSALVQPIIGPFLTDENMQDFFQLLSSANIVNFKPEFLTTGMENLAMIGQLLGYFDKNMERALYELYLSPQNIDHKKQRGRTAPNRDYCYKMFMLMRAWGLKYGLTTSICYWVRTEVGITEDDVPIVNQNGYRCLGYQTQLLEMNGKGH